MGPGHWEAALSLGSSDSADPGALEVADTSKCLEPLAALSGELEHSGFWSKSLPSSEDNYSPFEKELLVCYLA